MTTLQLYHGSKRGIEGAIAPRSRSKCDFGSGFYMGTERMQSLTLVCGYETARLYTLAFDPEGLSVLELGADLDWALFVAYNRGALEVARGSELYERCARRAEGHDVIVGPIANDRMFVVLDRFFAGQITDAALVSCLSVLRLGSQYVAKTDRACQRVRIVGVEPFGAREREELARTAQARRLEGISRADQICRDHRREGRYFDEIVGGGAS